MEIKVKTFYLKNWEEPIKGLVVTENKKWVLIHHIPSDYAIDGYSILKKAAIVKSKRAFDEKQRERVLTLRNQSPILPSDFVFGDTVKLLEWVEQHYELFEFQDSEEGVMFIGKVNRIVDGKELIIDSITPRGCIIKEHESNFALDDIRLISFDSDYFNAVKLLMKDNLKENKK